MSETRYNRYLGAMLTRAGAISALYLAADALYGRGTKAGIAINLTLEDVKRKAISVVEEAADEAQGLLDTVCGADAADLTIGEGMSKPTGSGAIYTAQLPRLRAWAAVQTTPAYGGDPDNDRAADILEFAIDNFGVQPAGG